MDDFVQSPELYISFQGKDWAIIRAHLKGRQDSLMSVLCSDLSHDATNVIRGELRAIRNLLSLESAAPQGRPQE